MTHLRRTCRIRTILPETALDSRTFLSDIQITKTEVVMEKRARFIAELRAEAKAKGLSFRQEAARGKGGHAMIWVGDKVTTLPSREIDPKTAAKIRKNLGLS
ncbi:hypothetical protein [Xanthobacter sediminis]